MGQQWSVPSSWRKGDRRVGSPGWFFVFLDGEYLGKRPVGHFQPPEERGYTDLGRVTVELLEPRAFV